MRKVQKSDETSLRHFTDECPLELPYISFLRTVLNITAFAQTILRINNQSNLIHNMLLSVTANGTIIFGFVLWKAAAPVLINGWYVKSSASLRHT